MTKQQLIDHFAREKNISLKIAKNLVDTFFNEIIRSLSKEDRVEIRGFGTFKVKKYCGYEGRNPKTGESVLVKPKKMPHFKVGKDLKFRLNNGLFRK